MKRAIVTGACGFLGLHLVRDLLDNGVEVLALDLPEKKAMLPLQPGLDFLGLDLAQAKELSRHISGCWDTFYHLAWRGVGGPQRADYLLQMENVRHAVACYQAAGDLGCEYFLCMGTMSERQAEMALQRDIISENYIYAISKNYLHALLRTLSHRQSARLCWCTLPNIYGEGDRSSNLVNYTVQTLLQGEKPSYTMAQQPMDFLHVSDVAQALRLVGLKGEKKSYYIGSGTPLLLREYLEAIRDIVSPGSLLGIGEREEDGSVYRWEWLDNGDLAKDTGFVPRMTFDEGIRQLSSWLRNL